MKIPIYQVDAFTSEVFSGNPAAVCILDAWIDDRRLQSIAKETHCGGCKMSEEVLERYARRVGYTSSETESFRESGHRIRQIDRLSKAAPLYSIVAEVVESRHCNSGHKAGQRLILDVDGSLISKLCPSRMCVYLLSQLAIPVALINERLSEGLEPNAFHFMRYVRCPDVGVECFGYGEVTLKVEVVRRVHTGLREPGVGS